jgi:protein SCO1/2
MTRPAAPPRSSSPVTARRPALAALGLSLVLAACGGASPLGSPGFTNAAGSSAPAGSYLLPDVVPAPPIELTDQDGRPFSLASLRGQAVLLSFGYTHCPDVCPATVGVIGQVVVALTPEVAALFVTIDPERDTAPWLKEYVRYLAAGYTAATGTPEQVRATADAWGVKYARVDATTPGEYSMTHTSDVFLVDRAGYLRARFPFGTGSGAMAAIVRQVLDRPEPTGLAPIGGSPSPVTTATSPVGPASPSAPAELELGVEVVSSSVWAGGHSPVILALTAPAGRIDDPAAVVSVQLETRDNAPVGGPRTAVAVRPPGESRVSFVATVDPPTPGWWRLAVSATVDGEVRAGSADLAVLDPGGSAPLGTAAPAVRTPTLADVAGLALAVTTDPAPDLRLYRTSTSDALAAHQPFVLVVDSTRFRTTTACGKALVMVRYLVDRWPSIAFIHLEPFRYDVVTDTAVLVGTLAAPTLVDAAAAWGIGQAPWSATSMPWIFVVDGSGTVRAKYQGVIGSDDVDVIVSLIAQGG